MTHFEQWKALVDDSVAPAQREAFIRKYYDEEREAYDRILGAYPERLSGAAAGLRERLGFSSPAIFAGFVDGINPSLEAAIDVETLDDATPVALAIDFEKLYWNMHEARAAWLHQLPSWSAVLSEETRDGIVKRFRASKMAHSEKVGRNDPCPCGSGRKYKVCCGKA